MGQKQQSTGDPTTEPKKRRRVGFSNVDSGIEANECITIYMVSSREQVGASDSFCISPVDLNGFFDEAGKIYGYQGLKITIWISSLTFHAYADITYESTSDGGKGITDLKNALQRIFAETLVENKDDFLRSFSAESHLIRSIVSTGEIFHHKASNGYIGESHLGEPTSDMKVFRMAIGNTGAGHLYSRLIPLVLLLIDGSNPIDVADPGWELFVLIHEKNDEQGDIQHRLLGFTAVYRFYHYPDKTRLRLSQILVLPPYQHKGYGRQLVEVVNKVAISEDVYDFTVEEPLDHFQHVRTCVDIQRLLAFDAIQDAINSAVSNLKQGKLSKRAHVPRFIPPSTAIDAVRKTLKINRKQFLQCWEVLIYLGLDSEDKGMEDFATIISNRVKADILGKDSGSGGKQVIEVPSYYNPEMSFVMFRSGSEGSIQMDENQTNQKEQLQQLVDERLKEIKLIAQKLRPV
ncbi:histone acetyltransferase type B catalytic subunit [Ricinus communis]|uniref:histone acetyltransferase n=1 Tax=Ricinus communis TaxID=3988 RepID=B9RKC6_RICCO|nr:histone acetyltransferase type B catalytic subunit [Ricinus communis]EEF48124.1 histone acetyltransferase type B catalytic subunit, putative [Ricinus communis]|eukprot:XP_002514170.1 histone acetyltransferase type B catalytic subunit [Ricinus communis]